MRKLLCLLVLLLGFVAPSARADDLAAKLFGMCTEAKAFGVEFGAKEEGFALMGGMGGNSGTITPPKDSAPINEIGLAFTQYGRKVHTVDATLKLKDAAASRVLEVSLINILAKAGFIKSKELQFGPNYLPGTADKRLGYNITTLGNELIFSCSDLALFKQAFNEVTGQVQVDAPPEEPEVPLPAFAEVTGCDVLAQRSLTVATLKQQMRALGQYRTRKDNYYEQLWTYKTQQMIKQGIWSKDRTLPFMQKLIREPEMVESLKLNWGRPDLIFGVVTDILVAVPQKVDSASCKSMVGGYNELRDVSQVANPQWDYFLKRLDEVAKNSGIDPRGK